MKEFVKKQWVQPALTMIPLIISILFYFTGKPYMLITSVIFLLLLVAFLPVCEKRENLWMFVFSSVSLLPANIRFSVLVSHWAEKILYWDSAFMKIIVFLLALHILFCMEQIILGFITRLLWQRQYKHNVCF